MPSIASEEKREIQQNELDTHCKTVAYRSGECHSGEHKVLLRKWKQYNAPSSIAQGREICGIDVRGV
jgi:hypothetical protein